MINPCKLLPDLESTQVRPLTLYSFHRTQEHIILFSTQFPTLILSTIKMAVEDEPSPLSSVSSGGVKETFETTAAAAGTTTERRQPPRKRRRIIISCTECHRRKQKCDRNLPCTNCVSRNKQDSCRYEAAAPTAKRAREYGGPSSLAVTNADINPENGGGQQKQQLVGRRPSKYDIDPRLTAGAAGAAGVPEAGGADERSTASSPVLKLAGSGDMANFGYAGTGVSTLGFLKRIDNAQTPGESLSSLAMGTENTAYFGTRERYKSLVRQLPARPYIEKLVDIYFKDFNWQYNVSLFLCWPGGPRGML